MTKLTQRATWCEDQFAAEEKRADPDKCPDCGAVLRARAGHDYCWFCEKEVDRSAPRKAPSAMTPVPKAEEKPSPKKPPFPPRIQELLNNDVPMIKGKIVFDDEDAEETEGEVAEFELDEIEEVQSVMDAAPIEDDDVIVQARKDDTAEEVTTDPATTEEDGGSEEDWDEGPEAKADEESVSGDDEGQDDADDEEWGTDDDLSAESNDEERTKLVDDEVASSDDENDDDFVIDEDESEDVEEMVKPKKASS